MAKLYKITPFFVDERGEMSHLLKNNISIDSALLITCKKGAIRANHLHKKDSHYSYLLEGKMNYYFKPENREKIKKIILNKGDMIFTPAGEVHAMKFVKDSVFLAMATEKRDRSRYEDDTVRIKLI